MSQYEVQFEACKDMADPNSKQRKEAKEIIAKAPTCIDKNQQARTLVKGNLVRLDLQGQFDRNGVRYANLQIQLNKPRMVAAEGEAAEVEEEEEEEEVDAFGKPRSTTISIVLMPSGEEIPEAILNQAYNGSLDKENPKVKAVIVKK